MVDSRRRADGSGHPDDEQLMCEACVPQEIVERPVQLRGSALARGLLRLAGWRLCFDGLPARQGVVVVYPHTSGCDLVVGLCAKWATGVPVTFWGKDTLFDVPVFGAWLRWLGGVPVDRHAPHGAVHDMIARMRTARARDEFLWLALAPEGTRGRRERWRSGFYRVAVDADVPLALVALDYGRRRLVLGACLRLSGNPAIDMADIARRYEGVRGRHPGQASPIRLG